MDEISLSDDPPAHLPPPVWPPVAYPAGDQFGRATVTPAVPVVAGEWGTWTVEYVAGQYGIDDGGALRIAFHTISDWGTPQFVDPAAPDYCAVSCTTPSPCRLVTHFDGDLGVRPWKRTIVLRVRDAAVRPGDRIRVTLGDRSGGSPGARSQTFCGAMRFQVLLDAYGTGIFVPAGPPATLHLVPGPAHHLRVHAPSDVAAGAPFSLTVAARDRWGNVLWHRREPARLDQPGVQRLPVHDPETGLQALSNPVRCHAAGQAPAYQVFWGDLHAQTEETIGSGTLDEYFTFARQCAAIDFVGHQGNDFQITRDVWRQIMAKTQAYDAASEFITFAGYEWSGNTPGGGDHNVHFKGGAGQRFDLHRSSHWQVFDRSDEGEDRFPVPELYEAFRGRDDVILIPHVGGRYANLREFFDESLMPLIEIASCWGVFEWFADDAIRRGVVLGFSAGSDDHTARPGMSAAPRDHFATGGGLTAALAPVRSREAIWEALKARRTYATTGARMLLDVTLRPVTDPASHSAPEPSSHRSSESSSDPASELSLHMETYPMGSHLTASGPVEITAQVHGTAPLWRVEVLRWPEVIYRHPLPLPALPAGRHRLRIGWTGARIRARNRMTRWDGTLTVVGASSSTGSTSAAGGRILGATGWGFDHAENDIVAQDESSVRWHSETAGDWDGIVLDLEGPDRCVLEFASGPATFRFTPRDVAAGPLEIDAGGTGQRVIVETDPGPEQPLTVSISVRDGALAGAVAAVAPAGTFTGGSTDNSRSGRRYYVVRVTQQDGQVAWSSPIIVDPPPA